MTCVRNNFYIFKHTNLNVLEIVASHGGIHICGVLQLYDGANSTITLQCFFLYFDMFTSYSYCAQHYIIYWIACEQRVNFVILCMF